MSSSSDKLKRRLILKWNLIKPQINHTAGLELLKQSYILLTSAKTWAGQRIVIRPVCRLSWVAVQGDSSVPCTLQTWALVQMWPWKMIETNNRCCIIHHNIKRNSSNHMGRAVVYSNLFSFFIHWFLIGLQKHDALRTLSSGWKTRTGTFTLWQQKLTFKNFDGH